MNPDQLIERLCRLGFSSYEARAYVALLKNNPATGYEMAKRSGIPPSKIYEIINKLMDRSMISPITGNPVKYLPQNSKLFLKNLRQEFVAALDYLEEHLPRKQQIEFDYIWNIHQKKELLAKAQELVMLAKKEIILLAWDVELEDLLPCLKKKPKTVKSALIQFGDMELPGMLVYRHRIQKIIESEKGGRELILVVDNDYLLEGLISETGEVHGIYTSNRSLVQVALEYMKHEIYTNKIFNKFENILYKEYGEDMDRLRDIWHN
jgi:sugar-specific transcriptional regulator TrmB